MKSQGRPPVRRVARTLIGSVGALGIGLVAFAGVGYASEDADADSAVGSEKAPGVTVVEPTVTEEPVEIAAQPVPEVAPEIVAEAVVEEPPPPAADPVADPVEEPSEDPADAFDEEEGSEDADEGAEEEPDADAAEDEDEDAPKADAAVAAEVTLDSIVRDGCQVTITTSTKGSGGFEVRVWDDGVVIWTDTWSETQDETHTSVWTITNPAGTAAPGVGIYAYANGANTDMTDPWEYPDEVADGCSAAVPVDVSLPNYDPAVGVSAGDSLAITGAGFLAGETVLFTLGAPAAPIAAAGTPVGSAVAGEDGTFAGAFTVPGSTSPGMYSVTAYGERSFRSTSAEFEVVGEGLPPADPEGEIGDITRDGCLVSISIETAGIGEFTLTVWDDGEPIYVDSWTTTTESGTHTTVWTITEPAGSGAPGVGFILKAGSRTLSVVDPWEYPDSVADNCSASVPVTVTIPGYDDSVGIEPGAEAPIEGEGFLAGETVTFKIDGAVVGSAVAAADGTFKGTFKVPADATPGAAKVTATGEESFRVGSASFRVAGATPPPAPEPAPAEPVKALAKTGYNAGLPLLLVAAGMVISGGAVLRLRKG